MSAELHPRTDRLPVAWRALPISSYRGPTLRALPDLAQLPAPEASSPARTPVIRNAFLGREAPLRDAVRRLSLPDGKLVTIAGRSGVGKTRLSYEVARRVVVTFSGGTALIDFSVPDVRP